MADRDFNGFGTLSRQTIRKYIEKENTLARHTFTSVNLNILIDLTINFRQLIANDKESDNDISSPLLIWFHKQTRSYT